MKIIVTGASRGIGYHTVTHLAKDASNQIVAVARDEEKLEALAKNCYDEFGNSQVFPVPFDLSLTESIRDKLLPSIHKKLGSADILINNAGYLKNKDFQDIGQEELLFHFKVNFFSVYELIRQSLNLLETSKIKHIVNVGTMGAVQGRSKFRGMSAYISGKAALANLTESLAVELKDKGIKTNYLALGAVETSMFREAFPGQKAPLSPEEMAGFIADFALNGWKYFNGKILPVTPSLP